METIIYRNVFNLVRGKKQRVGDKKEKEQEVHRMVNCVKVKERPESIREGQQFPEIRDYSPLALSPERGFSNKYDVYYFFIGLKRIID